MRWRWVTLGSIAVLGAFYLYARLLLVLQAWPPYAPFLGFAIAGLVAGGTMARHALVVPWREPVGAALGAAGFVAVFWALEPAEVALFVGGAPAALLSIALVVGGAIGGAAFVRRFLDTRPTLVASALLDAQLLGGFSMIVLAVMTATHGEKGAFIALVLLGVVLAGFFTQLVTPVRSAWACSAGSVVLVLILLSGGGGGRPEASKLIGGFLALWAVGAIGAAIAWRVKKRPEPEADVPPARLT